MAGVAVEHVVVHLCAADAGGLHAHGGGEVRGPKAHRRKARGAGGDFFHMGDTCGGFDDDLEGNRFAAALGGLDRRDEGVDGVDVSGTADLGDHDLVEPVGGLFHQVDHVFVPIGGIEAVDTHGEVFAVPINLMRGFDDVGAGSVLVCRCYAVFEIKVDDVCGGGGHLFEEFDVGARAEELTAVRTGGGSGLQTEGHGAAFEYDYFNSDRAMDRLLRRDWQGSFCSRSIFMLDASGGGFEVVRNDAVHRSNRRTGGAQE